jgi:HKD family nuclease
MPGYSIVTQPLKEIEYRSLLKAAISQGTVNRFDAAVAYATYGGVKCLLELLGQTPGAQWEGIEKRWLVGIDWMRSEPAALDFLAGLNNSTVRVHDGRHVVDRAGCTPRLPFHPKTFLLQGDGYSAAVIGSGNLSKNGLSRGHEVGVVITVGGGLSEQPARKQVVALSRWFDALWRDSAKWKAIRGDYLAIYKSKRNFTALVPTDDDSADTDASSM